MTRSRDMIALACLIGCLVGCDRSGPNSEPNIPARENTSDLNWRDQLASLQQRGDLPDAIGVLRAQLLITPDDTQVLERLAALYDQTRQPCEAASIYQSLSESDPSRASRFSDPFHRWMQCGDFVAAETSLSAGIQRFPDDPMLRRLLAQLLTAQGRRYESSLHVRKLIRLRQSQPIEALSLVDLSGPFLLVDYGDLIDREQTTLFTLGAARADYVRRGDPKEVLKIIEQVRLKFPGNAAAAAFQGRLLAESGQMDAMAAWLESVPAGIEKEPEYWHAVGTWLLQSGSYREAVGAFVKTLRLDPSNRQSMQGIAQAMDSLEQSETAAITRESLAKLDQVFRFAKDADAGQARKISQQLQELVRPWESAAWLMQSAIIGGTMQQTIPVLQQRHAAITQWESGATSDQIAEARIKKTTGISPQDWPLPDRVTLGNTKPADDVRLDPSSTGEHRLVFDEISKSIKLLQQTTGGLAYSKHRMSFEEDFFLYHVNGCGLGVIDFDLDGRCDLYLTYADGKPMNETASTANQLFRQLPDQSVIEVSSMAGVGDHGFGQGVCAGDVNQDGLPDLLVANIGDNVAFINQGDGTFRQADLFAVEDPNWTSSLALADLSGDHLPDIFGVNYIDDATAMTKHCESVEACMPQQFNAAIDSVLLGLPSGEFESGQSIATTEQFAEYGFGIVIANFDHQFGNDLFVTNDGDLNHFWSSIKNLETASSPFRLIESAGLRGCSIGRGGNSQACMGVASGDFNRDGHLDLHVTNFLAEPVNLFLHNGSEAFIDEAVRYSLADPSYGVLGFGTQSSDFDNDGWPDLAVLNGHIFDDPKPDVALQMVPQLFAGSSRGFVSVGGDQAGAYWKTPQIGRTLAMMDWDRDGQMDLVANHIDRQPAVLQNQSQRVDVNQGPRNHWLQLELVGSISERDAIGAEVRVTSGDQTWTGWQIGGDGYMCTNEAVVHFGLGSIGQKVLVEIDWPSGSQSRYENVALDARYLAVEGVSGKRPPPLHLRHATVDSSSD